VGRTLLHALVATQLCCRCSSLFPFGSAVFFENDNIPPLRFLGALLDPHACCDRSCDNIQSHYLTSSILLVASREERLMGISNYQRRLVWWLCDGIR